MSKGFLFFSKSKEKPYEAKIAMPGLSVSVTLDSPEKIALFESAIVIVRADWRQKADEEIRKHVDC